MEDIGTDIKSSWELKDGDLVLVNDEENIVQSIINRLNCWLNSMDLFYLEYGSVLSSFLGWKRIDETLGFLKIEIENTLNQDPRLRDYDLSLDYDDNGAVKIDLDFHLIDEDFGVNLVISKEGSIVIAEDTDDVKEEQ